MSEPTSPELGPPERLHPLFLLGGLAGSLRGLAGGYAFMAYLFVAGRYQTALAVLAALLAIMLVSVLLYWRNFQFQVGPNEIRIDSGIFSRTHRSIPFDRVQDVDISQRPLARLLGLAAVRFETGASGRGKADEGVLHAIPLQRAEELRELVRARRSPGTVAAAAPDTEPKPVYAMGGGRLVLAGLFNFSLAIFAGLFGLTQTFGDVLGFDPLKEEFWNELFATGSPLADYLLAHRSVSIVAGLVLLLLAGFLTGIVRTLLRDYGFRLDRTDTSLRRRRGLLTRTDVSLPIRRVQAALVATGPVRDRFGWRELKLQNLAQDEGSGDHVVAPLAQAAEVSAILGELGWPPVGDRIEWRRVSRAYIWTLVIGLAPLLLILSVPLAVLGAAPILAPESLRERLMTEFLPAFMTLLVLFAMLLLAIAMRALAWTRTAYALDADRLLVRTGWWRRRLRILPTDKIQSIDLAESFVSRWFDISRLIFGVAGGGGFSAHNIPAIQRHEARELRDRLLGSAR